ncbi:MAG: hypothetical protein K9G37_12020 [Crocinitomicaceae bacterium]|nr:hypothetical protein [Crocinitomicaceae bacterium]
MGIIAQLLILVPLIYVGITYGEKTDRSIRIKKNKKYKWLNYFLIVILFLSLSFAFLLFPYPTLGILVVYTLLFPLFYFVNNWSKIKREIYNALTISQLFLIFYLILQPGLMLKEFCHYLGFGFREKTVEYCCDENGNSATRDFFYVNSGNGKLDTLLGDYFNYVIIVVGVLLIYYIISIDKRIRNMVREMDSVNTEMK